MQKGAYTFREYLKDRGEEDLLRNEPEPEITGLVLREVKLASAAFLALVVAVVLIFYQPEQDDTSAPEANTLRTAVTEANNPFEVPSRDLSESCVETAPPATRSNPPVLPPVPIAAAAPAAAASAPPAAETETRPASAPGLPEAAYTVQPGDTLEGISRRFYGSTQHWRRIAERNGINDPLKLRIGQKITLPTVSERR